MYRVLEKPSNTHLPSIAALLYAIPMLEKANINELIKVFFMIFSFKYAPIYSDWSQAFQ